MKTTSLRGLPLLLVLAGMLVLGATSGAVAGGLVTSAQIQDDTIKSKDVHDGTLKVSDLSDTARADLKGDPGTPGSPGSPGVSGWNRVSHSESVLAESNGSSVAHCPAGQKVLGGGGDFSGGYDGVQISLGDDFVTVYGHNTKTVGNTLWAYAICANVS